MQELKNIAAVVACDLRPADLGNRYEEIEDYAVRVAVYTYLKMKQEENEKYSTKTTWVCKKDVVTRNGKKEKLFIEGKVYDQTEVHPLDPLGNLTAIGLINEKGNTHAMSEEFLNNNFELWETIFKIKTIEK